LKAPICAFDAKTGILCAKCESKIKSGNLTYADVEASIKLSKLSEHNLDISKFTLTGALRIEEDLILLLRGSDILALRGNSILLKKVEQAFNGKVWFIESEATDRRFLENLFFPAKIMTVNLVWLPDGNKITRVIIAAGKSDQLRSISTASTIQKIQKIAKFARNIELLVEFEQKEKEVTN
jgi:transcription antitermination factor NusA-like protein